MKTDCDIIRDLLPLYAEKLTSESSCRAVTEHLAKCESCRREYLRLTQTTQLPVSVEDAQNLKKARRRDRRYKLIGIAAVLLCAALIIVCVSPSLPHFFSLFYPGNRITLQLDGSVDGEPIAPDYAHITCSYEGYRQEVSCGDGEISVKGDEYGKYSFTVPTDAGTVKLDYIHTNWWQIDTCILRFDIDSKDHRMIYVLNDRFGSTEAENNTYYLYEML